MHIQPTRMFLLIILFGLAALGMAFALYLQADIAQKPLPPVKPPAVSARPSQLPPGPDASAVIVNIVPADGSTVDSTADGAAADKAATANAGSGTQTP